MVTGEKIFDLPFYNAKGILTGGDIYGPRYRIAKITVEEAPEEEGGEGTKTDYFDVCVWNAGTCFEKTPEECKTYKRFPFDAEGREAVITWLNEQIPEKQSSKMQQSVQ